MRRRSERNPAAKLARKEGRNVRDFDTEWPSGHLEENNGDDGHKRQRSFTNTAWGAVLGTHQEDDWSNAVDRDRMLVFDTFLGCRW